MKHLIETIQPCKKHIAIFLLASIFLAPQLCEAAKGGQGQGGGKGGAGEDGTACYTFDINEEISHDGNPEYCHGVDGQATVPSRFRIDLKKFIMRNPEVMMLSRQINNHIATLCRTFKLISVQKISLDKLIAAFTAILHAHIKTNDLMAFGLKITN